MAVYVNQVNQIHEAEQRLLLKIITDYKQEIPLITRINLLQLIDDREVQNQVTQDLAAQKTKKMFLTLITEFKKDIALLLRMNPVPIMYDIATLRQLVAHLDAINDEVPSFIKVSFLAYREKVISLIIGANTETCLQESYENYLLECFFSNEPLPVLVPDVVRYLSEMPDLKPSIINLKKKLLERASQLVDKKEIAVRKGFIEEISKLCPQ